MSITLMRNKDGKPVPIKLSVWDAFKGVPVPKPRIHTCNCCNKLHKPGTKQALPQPTVPSSNTDVKSDKAAKEKLIDAARANEDNFTKDEDSKVVAMKGNNETWAKIAETLGNGRTKDQVRSRFKQLQSVDSIAKTEEQVDSKEEDTGTKLTKAQKKAKAREEGLKKQQETQAKKDADKKQEGQTATSGVASSGKANEEPKSRLTSDKQKWIMAASKHYDRTGQRVTPEQARKMVEAHT